MVNNLNSSDFSEKLKNDKDGVLIDVRTPGEYHSGHIPNSILMNMYDPLFMEQIQKLDKNKNYYLYCRSGNRSFYTGRLMLQLGFTNIYNLSSGILDWNEPLKQLE